MSVEVDLLHGLFKVLVNKAKIRTTRLLFFIFQFQPHNKKVPCCIYFAALAVTDNLFIINCLELVLMMGYFPDYFKDDHCKFVAYHFHACGVMGSFIITGVTLERFLAVCFPLKSAAWRTTRRAKIIIMGICTFSLIFNIPYFFTAGMSSGLLCAGVSCSTFWCKVWSWTGFTLSFAIPFTALVTMNFFIVRAIRNRGKYFKEQSKSERKRDGDASNQTGSRSSEAKSKTNANKGDNSKDAQLTAMLLLVTTCFLIFTSPVFIRHLIFVNSNILKDVETFAMASLLYQCTQKSYFTNSAINFFLYCIAGSKFRGDCVALFCKKKKNQRNIESSKSNSVQETSVDS